MGENNRDNKNMNYRQAISRAFEHVLDRFRVIVTNTTGEPIPVTVVSNSVPGTPKQTRYQTGTAGTKITHVFDDQVKQFTITVSVDKCSVVRYNWSESDFDANKHNSIDDGGEYKMDNIYLTGKAIYMKCDEDDVTIEIEEWV